MALNTDTPATTGTGAAESLIDDGAAGWIWHGMAPIDDSIMHGGSGHAGGPGSYGAYTFTGTGVDVFAKAGPSVVVDGRGHKIGSLKVSIDGNVKADPRMYRSQDEDEINAFTITGLSSGVHVLQVEPDGGWAAVDYISVHGAPVPQEASKPGSTSSDGKSGDGSSAAHIPNGAIISLMASANNLYATVDSNPNKPIIAKADGVSGAQQFAVEDEGGGYVTLKSLANNMYVCVSPQDNALYAARPTLDKTVNAGEMFHWEVNPDNTISLKSYSNQMYVSANVSESAQQNKGILLAYRATPAAWEKFKVTSR